MVHDILFLTPRVVRAAFVHNVDLLQDDAVKRHVFLVKITHREYGTRSVMSPSD